MQQQQERSQEQQFDQECLDAQRSALEAVQIGRETLEATARQGEQLSHADRLADQTRYAVEKSARLLRGMTWSGWMANIVSKDKTKDHDPSAYQPRFSYDDVPEWANSTAQAIQNYRANVTVLAACETNDQFVTCRLVCDNMHRAASTCIAALEAPSENERPILQKLLQDLDGLRQRQRNIVQQKTQQNRARQQRQQQQEKQTPDGQPTAQSPGSRPTAASAVRSAQDEHLDLIASSLDEMNATALSMNEMMKQHNRIMVGLEEKSDENIEKSRMVSRRADRLAHSKVSADCHIEHNCRPFCWCGTFFHSTVSHSIALCCIVL